MRQDPLTWSRGRLRMLGACPACGSRVRDPDPLVCRDHRGDMAADTWQVRRCAACRSLYLDPRPDEASLAEAYADYYTHLPEREEVPSRGAGLVAWSLVHGYLNRRYGFSRQPARAIGYHVFQAIPPWRMKLDYYARHLSRERHPTPGRLLDVGCGNGAFLARAAEMGWDAHGLDPDPQAVATCRAQGLHAFQGTLASAAATLAGAGFDVMTLSHSIEHVADPAGALERSAALLRPGGTLWLALPNPGSVGARVYGGAWRELHPPYHLCIPPPSTLAAMLVKAGYADIRFTRRGAHARRMMRESADNARVAGGAGMAVRARLAPLLRILSDLMATAWPTWGEETVVIARRAR